MSKKKVTLKYSGLGPVSVTNRGGGVCTIKPGVNELNCDDWEHMAKQKDIQDMLKRGEKYGAGPKTHDEKGMGNIVLVKDGDNKKDGSGENKVGNVPGNSKDAKKLVAETEDTGLLKKWLESDDRAGVTNAIEKKLAEIEAYRKEHGDKESRT